jgi:thymidylate synthase (FAD)
MPTIKPYTSMSIDMINSTPNPASSVAIATGITMHRDAEYIPKPVASKFCKKLIDAGHLSVTEHVQMTFLCENISRSLLAQVSRQRTAHPTSGSQHYQEYSDYPMMISPQLFNEEAIMAFGIAESFDMSIKSYKAQLEGGVPKEEARQVLPNACGVNYLWTIDAANLFKFLRTRLCNRNVLEMRIFATRIKDLAIEYFPEMFKHAFPNCISGQCTEKALGMQCSQKVYLGASFPCIDLGEIKTEDLVTEAPAQRTIGLADLISRIKMYQRSMGNDYASMSLPGKMRLVVQNACALNVEVGELLREVPWKPWRPIVDQPHSSHDIIAKEFVDCLIFLVNISFCVGLDTDDILTAFEQVMQSNYERIQSGYSKTQD